MAIITYPLNGIEYLAEDAETYLCTRTSGVFSAEGHFAATATGESRQVSISPGLAWIKNSAYAGKSILNDGTVILEHDIADGTLSRIDRIVLRFDKSANLSEIAIKKGTPSSTPVPPSIERSELIYELGLHEVSIPAASTVITQANVKSTILDETVCGIMRDGVTGIPTAQLQEQATAIIENIAVQFNQFIGEKNEEFNVWFEQLTEILDENAAANLLNLINQNTSDIQGLSSDISELKAQMAGKATTATYTATLTADGWSDSVPYTQTVAVEGILDTDKPIYGVVYSGELEEKTTQKEAFALVDDLDTSADTLTFTCFEEKPTVDLMIQLEVVR